MAEISKIKLPSGSIYDLKDETARQAIAGGVSFIIAWDGNSQPVVSGIPAGVVVRWNGTDYTGTLSPETSGSGTHAQAGAFYLIHVNDGDDNYYDEYVPVGTTGSKTWEKLGSGKIDLSEYVKKGSVTTSNSTGITLSAHSVTSSTVSASGSFKPTGSNADSAVTIVPSTTPVYSMSTAGSVTAGTKGTPTVIDTTKFSGGSYNHTGFSGGSGTYTQGAFFGGSFTQGTDSYSPTNFTVSNEMLTITAGTFTEGTDSFSPATHGNDSHTHNAAVYGTDSFTAASINTGFYTEGSATTPTVVTLPTRSAVINAWTGYTSATAAGQDFTGDSATVNVSGNATITIADHTITDPKHSHTIN